MPLVKTFIEACKYKKLKPNDALPAVSMFPKEHRKALLASAKLFIIIDAINEGHKFNWDDYSEQKWYIWWWMNKPGFRLGGVGCCVRVRALAFLLERER